MQLRIRYDIDLDIFVERLVAPPFLGDAPSQRVADSILN